MDPCIPGNDICVSVRKINLNNLRTGERIFMKFCGSVPWGMVQLIRFGADLDPHPDRYLDPGNFCQTVADGTRFRQGQRLFR